MDGVRGNTDLQDPVNLFKSDGYSTQILLYIFESKTDVDKTEISYKRPEVREPKDKVEDYDQSLRRKTLMDPPVRRKNETRKRDQIVRASI